MSYVNKNEYNNNNNIKSIDSNVSSITAKQYQVLRNRSSIRQEDLQSLCNGICKDIGISSKPIIYKGIQPHNTYNGKLRQKILGNTNFTYINLYKFTAIRRKVVSVKQTIDTLIHEIMHNYDAEVLKFVSIHCSGFYHRIGDLTNKLKT